MVSRINKLRVNGLERPDDGVYELDECVQKIRMR